MAVVMDRLQVLSQTILDIIEGACVKTSTGDLERTLGRQHRVNRREFRVALRILIESGELLYTSAFGTTYIEKSFSRPVRVGRHVILTPPEHRAVRAAPDIEIVLKPGASFGVGQHPTTRLALEGVEFALRKLSAERELPGRFMLDIGAGSGVLALAALKMGIGRAAGTDIDSCAIAESMENAGLNGMSARFSVTNQPAESIRQCFHVIAANLRYPTLIRLSDYIAAHIHPYGSVILSGIREDEAEDVRSRYAELSFKCRWEKSANGWKGVVLEKQFFK